MPNWSYTYYTLTGDAGQIKELHGIMSELENTDAHDNPRWLGHLVERLGGDNDIFFSRGTWSDLEPRDGVFLSDVEGIWMTWNGGYIKTKPLSKGKYLCTVNMYKKDK